MRALRPDRLVLLRSGLWAVDGAQPVAAVLDPDTGAVRRVVAWPEVPPPSAAEDLWPPARVLGDGTSLWVQHGAGAPVVRVDLDGTAVAAWPDGAWLAACGPTGAWCTAPPPEQVLVRDGDPLELGLLPDRLLHVAPDGTVTVVATDRPVRSVRATPDALEVRLDDEPATLHELGAGTSEVEPSQRVLRLPWQEPLPASVTVADAAPPVGPDEVDDEHDATADGGRWHAPWCDLDEPGLPALGLVWHLGWDLDPDLDWDRGPLLGEHGLHRRCVAVAGRLDGTGTRTEVARWDLGGGRVVAAAQAGGRLAVAVDRGTWRPAPATPAPVEVVALDPHGGGVTVLLPGDAVDLTGRGWPLGPRPLDADSYAAHVLRTHAAPGGGSLGTGTSDVRVRLDGAWPDTVLEWSFRHDRRPGLRLRRRVPLFDELGRIAPPHFAGVHLDEDLATDDLPPAAAARDGVLEV